MSQGTTLRDALSAVPVVGILRGVKPEHAAAVGGTAAAAGITVLEVTLDSPGYEASIAQLASVADVVVGAGTVRSAEDVAAAARAGAGFLVSPMLSPDVMAAAEAHGLACVPGAASPTEIWAAMEAGAIAVKVFPARQLGGPDYLRAVRGPLGDPPLVPTGGIGADDAAAYLAAGAMAVGVGGSVFTRAALETGDVAQIGSLARELVRSLQ